jgi:hypothetical protein
MDERIDVDLSKPQFDCYRSQMARNLLLAGQGGGKSNVIGVMSWMLVSTCPGALGLIAANTYGQLSDSTLLEVTQVWDRFGWSEWTPTNPDGFFVIDKRPPASFVDHGRVFKSHSNKIFFRNGAVVMLASLDNFKNIEGRTISWALLDETADTKEVAVKEVITGRLRGSGLCKNIHPEDRNSRPYVPPGHEYAGEQCNPLYVFTKPAKEQWLTDMFELERFRPEIEETIYSETDYFFKEFDNKCVVIFSAYHNVPNVPYMYIKSRELELSSDTSKMLIYGSPFGKSGNEYYSNFDRRKHVGRVPYVPGYPLHFTLDFNVNPYMPANVWQIVPDGTRLKLNCIREYAFTSPKNTIEQICRAFLGEFGHLCNPGFFYYGDATGKSRLPSETVRDYYKIVEKELREIIYSSSRRLLKQNPRHRSVSRGTLGRREFMNAGLRGSYGFDLQIDESCKFTIADFVYVLEDANGAKLKKIEDVNGVACQRYGHMSDAADALICYNFGQYKKENQSNDQKIHDDAIA